MNAKTARADMLLYYCEGGNPRGSIYLVQRPRGESLEGTRAGNAQASLVGASWCFS